MTPKLTNDLAAAVDANDGVVETQAEQGGEFVVLRMDLYREMLGVSTNDEFEASVRACQNGLDDIEKGHFRPVADVISEMRKKNDAS